MRPGPLGSGCRTRQEAVPGGRDLAPAESIEHLAQACVVGQQPIAPGRIAEALEGRRRVDDIGEHDGGQDPIAWVVRRDADGSGAGPLDRLPGLVADHPGVVVRRDLVDGAGTDLEGLPVAHLDMQRPGHGIAEMVQLTGGGARDRPEIGRPAPSWLPACVSDHHLVEADDRRLPLRHRPLLVAAGEAPGLQARHRYVLSGDRGSVSSARRERLPEREAPAMRSAAPSGSFRPPGQALFRAR